MHGRTTLHQPRDQSTFQSSQQGQRDVGKAEVLRREFIPTGMNGQQLLNFIEEAKDHYKQMKVFYGYNCNMLNAM